MTPERYRKRPVTIEAMLFNGQNGEMVAEWCEGTYWPSRMAEATVIIHTLEGDMSASPGDWIIRGVQGEFYPCKPEIFAATYEWVES